MRDRTAMLIETFAALSSPEEFSLSPDGHSIAFTRPERQHKQIFSMPINGGWARRTSHAA